MKIGILTFHNAHNYGAVLQAHALQEVLGKFGHDVRIIDYRNPYVVSLYRIFDLNRFIHLSLKSKCCYLVRVWRRFCLKVIYDRYRKKYLHTTEKCDNGSISPFDRYVIGSDQVWSLNCTKDMDEVYFGQFIRPPHSRIIGYAISSVKESLLEIGEESIRQCIHSFSSISFREKSIARQVYDMTGIKAPVVLDPVLLLPVSYWNTFGNESKGKEKEKEKEKEKVVVYLIRNRFSHKTDRDILRKTRRLARTLNCGVTKLPGGFGNPETFVATIRSARYVITNSFHGAAFALIFGKPLYAIRSYDSTDERFLNLLQLVSAGQMTVGPDFSPVAMPTDYDLIRRNIETLRKKSLEYLKDNI